MDVSLNLERHPFCFIRAYLFHGGKRKNAGNALVCGNIPNKEKYSTCHSWLGFDFR